MADTQDLFTAKLTLKSQISVIKHIKVVLTENQEKIFRDHCFGHWLDVRVADNDPGFVHHILKFRRREAPGDHDHPHWESDDLCFRTTSDHFIRFGRRDFCLVTGLQFGPNDKMTDHIPPTVRETTPAFKKRVFPGNSKILVSNIIALLGDKGLFSGPRKMSDEDCVRVCMLLLIFQGFMGKQPTHVIEDDYMHIVEDFDVCDRYPWGNIIWARTYEQLDKGLGTRLSQHDIKYTLSGFGWACKVWIWEAGCLSRLLIGWRLCQLCFGWLSLLRRLRN